MVADNKINETFFTVGKSQPLADFLSQISTFPGMTVEMDCSQVIYILCERLSDVMQQNCIFKEHCYAFINISADLDGSIR